MRPSWLFTNTIHVGMSALIDSNFTLVGSYTNSNCSPDRLVLFVFTLTGIVNSLPVTVILFKLTSIAAMLLLDVLTNPVEYVVMLLACVLADECDLLISPGIKYLIFNGLSYTTSPKVYSVFICYIFPRASRQSVICTIKKAGTFHNVCPCCAVNIVSAPTACANNAVTSPPSNTLLPLTSAAKNPIPEAMLHLYKYHLSFALQTL